MAVTRSKNGTAGKASDIIGKMKYFRSILAVILLSLVQPASLAETWTDIVILCKANNNSILGAKKQLEANRWSYYKTLGSFLPQVSASMSIGEASSDTSARAATSSYGLSATQSLFSGFSNINTSRKAYAQLNYYEAGLNKTVSDSLYDARGAFVDTRISEENITLQEQIFKRRKDNNDLIQLRYESGREDKGNLMLTQADKLDAQYNVEAAKRAHALAQVKLSQVIGKSISKIELDEKVLKKTRPDFDRLIETAPSYLMSKYTLESARIDSQSTVSGFLPGISLSAGIRNSGGIWPPSSRSNSWSVSLSYPFFPGGTNITDVLIKANALEKANQDFENIKKQLRYGVEAAYIDLENKLEALEVAQFFLKTAAERAMIARAKYMNGLMSYDDWDRIENSYITAGKSLLNAKRSALLSEAAWYNSYGGYKE